MNSFSSITRRLLFTILITGFCLNAHAQENQLSNPGFESSFVGWNQFNGRVGEWDSMDAMDSPDSGSAFLSHVETSNGIVPLVLFQCITLSGPQEIEFGGDLLVPEGQPSGTGAFVFVEPFANSNCSGAALGAFSASSTQVSSWITRSGSISTSSEIMSVRLGLGVFKPNGETADASAFFDNIFFNLEENSAEFEVNPSMSASWFDPAQDGHGIMIHLLDDSNAWMCWFTFNNDGEPVWICALGVIQGDSIVFEQAFTLEGGAFPPSFDPDLIVNVPWGSITVTFTGCNAGSMTWTTNAAGFQSGSMPLTRLTTLWGATCVEP